MNFIFILSVNFYNLNESIFRGWFVLHKGKMCSWEKTVQQPVLSVETAWTNRPLCFSWVYLCCVSLYLLFQLWLSIKNNFLGVTSYLLSDSWILKHYFNLVTFENILHLNSADGSCKYVIDLLSALLTMLLQWRIKQPLV